MEWVDHVHIVEVGCRCLVGNVHGVLQREVPHREGLKLRISSRHATLMLLIKLAQAHRHLAATRSGSCDDDQRTRGRHIIVFAESLVRVDEFHIIRIALNGVVHV